MNGVIERSTCRACGGSWAELWNLGTLRLNDFPRSMDARERHPAVPLQLCRCHPCGLIQLRHTTPPEWMFREHYWYRSGINQAMVKHLQDVVDKARELVPVGAGDVVMDIGANDGTLLSNFGWDRGKGTPFRIGFEPAPNLQSKLRRHAELPVCDFFPQPQFQHLKSFYTKPESKPKIITSVAMFYDLEDPNAFVSEIARLLHPEGIWVNQLAYLPAMLRNGAWDGICHEHLCYYSLRTLQPLYLAHGLQVLDVEEVPVNEGSIRVYATHRDGKVPIGWDAVKRVRAMAAAEEALHLHDTNEPYFDLQVRAEKLKHSVRNFMLGTVLKGEKVDILGASTKGNTFLQYVGLGPQLIRRAIDRSDEKSGRFTVNGVPIVSEEEGRKDPAPWLLCLIWAFKDSIIERERGKWPAGTKLVFAMPELEVVTL